MGTLTAFVFEIAAGGSTTALAAGVGLEVAIAGLELPPPCNSSYALSAELLPRI